MQLRHPRMVHRQRRQLAEPRDEILVDRRPVELGGPRPAAHRDVVLEIAPGDVRHRRPFRERRRQRLRHRLLARLDPRDDERRPPPRLLGRDHPVRRDRHPLRRLALRARLRDVDLAPRRIHPHPEPRELPVPEHRVLLDPQRLHRAPRDRLLPDPRHSRIAPMPPRPRPMRRCRRRCCRPPSPPTPSRRPVQGAHTARSSRISGARGPR